jgi:NADP-dependent 3-hydroxy acid dehydrogenase YdfG
VALALADAGASIILIGRRLNRLELVAATVRNLGAHAACYSADISSGSSLHEVAERIKTELMHVDILVQNAAMYAAAPPELLLQPADVASVVINALSLPRTAEVTDISIRPMFNTKTH